MTVSDTVTANKSGARSSKSYDIQQNDECYITERGLFEIQRHRSGVLKCVLKRGIGTRTVPISLV